MDTGKRVYEFLKSNNIPLELLSELTGLNIDQIRESLERNPPEIRIIEKIAKELRVPLYTFLTEEDSELTPEMELKLSREQELRSLLAQAAMEISRLRAMVDEQEKLIQSLQQKDV